MGCKCRDTDSKRCRWELPSDHLAYLLRVEPRKDRKRFRATFDPFADADNADDMTIVAEYHFGPTINLDLGIPFDPDGPEGDPDPDYMSDVPTNMVYGDTLELWDAEEWTQAGFSIVQVF